MWLFNLLKQRKKHNKKLKTEKDCFSVSEPLKQMTTVLEGTRKVEVLIEAYQKKGDRNISLSFKHGWQIMDTPDKIESLVVLEKELANYRNMICQELNKYYTSNS